MKLNFFNQLIVRTAALPYATELTEDRLFKLWQDPLIREGIYLASKPLFLEINRHLEKRKSPERIIGVQEASNLPVGINDDVNRLTGNSGKSNDDAKNAESLLQSLYKYLSRMSNRSTPFGIFSGVTDLAWGAATNIVLQDTFERRIAPDAVLNLQLAKLNQELNPDAQYKINNTVYRQGDEYRFISYQVADGERFYQLSSLKFNEVLEYLIEDMRDFSLTRSQIVALSGYEAEEFLPFLNQLIDIQFLKYARQPGIGLDFPDYITPIAPSNFKQLIARFSKLNQPQYAETDYIASYQEIENNITAMLGAAPANTFHVTRYNQLSSAVLSSSIQTKLEKAIRLLNNLNSFEPNPRVARFKKEFQDKYQERSIPLLEVFDTDTGIPYGNWYEKSTFFTEGLEDVSTRDNPATSYKASDLKMLKVLTDAFYHKQYTFIMPDDFAEERPMTELPHTMAATFQVFDNGSVLLEQVSGTGAMGLLSRFAGGSQAINDLALHITKEEALAKPEAIYAEIVHLPEERSLNIMSHPQFWNYEIQYIDHAHGSNVINLADLEVLVVKNSFWLYSRKHQKEVIPRLSSAYNYSRSQHPIYTFLCDIQHQQSNNGLIFKWGELVKDQVFFPRVITKENVVLHRATWRLTAVELQPLQAQGKSLDQFKTALADFRIHWMLPASFMIVKGDNELLIDSDNEISLQVLLKDISKKPAELILKECLHREWNTVVKNEKQDSYAHQFVAPFFLPNVTLSSNLNPVVTAIQRDFMPGSEWLYLKVFLGENTTQQVLLVLNELFENMFQSTPDHRLIRKWFFIRYKEGGNHIRIRVELVNERYFQEVYFAIMEILQPFVTQKLISNIQLDTYVREVERYGAARMELAEDLFAVDSRFCCNAFQLLQQDYMNKDWLLVFWAVIDYLERMSKDKLVQLGFAERQLNFFLQEFDDKAVKVQIDQLNRKYRGDIDQLKVQYQELLLWRKNEVDVIVSRQPIIWEERFLGSMIHMLLNRYFHNQQRLHECLLYGFIVKALKTDIARATPKFSKK